MKKLFIALLIVSLSASVSFAMGAGSWGVGMNNLITNMMASEVTNQLLVPSASLFYQITDDISCDLGFSSSSRTADNGNDNYAQNTHIKFLYNLGKGKSRAHVGIVGDILTISSSTSSKTTYTNIGLLIGGEIFLSDNAALQVDVNVLESMNRVTDPSSTNDYNGTIFLFNPTVGLRWYI